MSKSFANTDWLSTSDQIFWFEKFKSIRISDSENDSALDFKAFQEFLNATLYEYFASNTNYEGNHDATANQNGVLNLTCESTSGDRYTEERELRLFKVFDCNQDGKLNLKEFERMCEFWLHRVFHPLAALIVVDVQNDFIDGSLALINGPAGQDGLEVVDIINGLVKERLFNLVVYTQDWHPPDHIGFHENLHLRKYKPIQQQSQLDSGDSSNLGASQEADVNDRTFKLKRLVKDVKPFDVVLFDDGKMEQKLWPTHCIQNSWGAQLHPKLEIQPDALRIYKGTLSNVDAYSAFWDNKRLNETGLRQALLSSKIDDVYVCGLALDYCVAATALDSVKAGFMTFVIEDACRGIDEIEIDKQRDQFIERGIIIVNCETVKMLLMEMEGSTSDSRDQNENSTNRNLRNGDTSNSNGTTSFNPDARCDRARSNKSKGELISEIAFNRAMLLSELDGDQTDQINHN